MAWSEKARAAAAAKSYHDAARMASSLQNKAHAVISGAMRYRRSK